MYGDRWVDQKTGVQCMETGGWIRRQVFNVWRQVGESEDRCAIYGDRWVDQKTGVQYMVTGDQKTGVQCMETGGWIRRQVGGSEDRC